MSISEQEQEAFKTALDAAVRERAELDVLIKHLAARAGVPIPEGATVTPSAPGAPPPNVDPTSLVADGEFFGMSATKASKALMSKLGRTRPLKTPEILAAIKKGGVKMSTEVLYKSLQRSPDFILVQKGTWGLAEWYPANMRKGNKADPKDESVVVDDLDPTPDSDPAQEGDDPTGE